MSGRASRVKTCQIKYVELLTVALLMALLLEVYYVSFSVEFRSSGGLLTLPVKFLP